MQMKADSKRLWLRRLDEILALELITGLEQAEPAVMYRPEQPSRAVMIGLDPLRPAGIQPLGPHLGRAAAEPGVAQFRGGYIGDRQGRMRGGAAQRVTPFAAAGRGRATIHDQPLLADGKFKRQRPGMGQTILSRWWWRAGVHEQQGFAGAETVQAALAKIGDGAARASGLSQHQVDQAAQILLAAVEEREPTIPMAQRPHR